MTKEFVVDNYKATVIIPKNPNGKWIWKTEFFYAFDKAEQSLFDMGYTRVYYCVSDKYGSPQAVELMYNFYLRLLEEFPFLEKQANIFGFSRGALYAFNFTLQHPECVKKIYFDAPVFDLNSWPRKEIEYNELQLREQVKKEYGFNSDQQYENSKVFPVYNLNAYFKLNKPTLLVAGEDDSVVDFSKNSQLMLDYCKNNNIHICYYIKKDCDHHPHSFGNINGSFLGKEYGKVFTVYSSNIKGTDKHNTKTIISDEKRCVNLLMMIKSF